MSLAETICAILSAMITMYIVIYIFEKSTREAQQAIDLEYENYRRYVCGRFENEE